MHLIFFKFFGSLLMFFLETTNLDTYIPKLMETTTGTILGEYPGRHPSDNLRDTFPQGWPEIWVFTKADELSHINVLCWYSSIDISNIPRSNET